MALSDDDRLNLQVALKARDLNPHIRVVLRQFNQVLGRKLEAEPAELLRPLAGIALGRDVRREPRSTRRASTRSSFPARFAKPRRPSTTSRRCSPTRGTARNTASTSTPASARLLGAPRGRLRDRRADAAAAQQRLGARIVALDGSPDIPPAHAFAPDDSVIAFARGRPARGERRHARPGARRAPPARPATVRRERAEAAARLAHDGPDPRARHRRRADRLRRRGGLLRARAAAKIRSRRSISSRRRSPAPATATSRRSDAAAWRWSRRTS